MIKKIFNNFLCFIKDVFTEPLCVFGPMILSAVFNNYYFILLYIITIPIAFNILEKRN